MLAQASTGLIETWFVARLGTDALAGMALVFPGFMMMQMLSGGAMGGGINSAIARALGSRRRDDADALVMHAVIINLALGLTLLRPGAELRADAVPGDGRPGRLARRGAALLEYRVRRHAAGLADERAGQRDPRHRQHVRAVGGAVPGRGAAAAAVAQPDLRAGAVSGPGHRRRRGRGAGDHQPSPPPSWPGTCCPAGPWCGCGWCASGGICSPTFCGWARWPR